MLWSPFFVLAHVCVSLLNLLGFEVHQDGFGFSYELPVYIGSFVYGLLGLLLTWRLLVKLYEPAIATLATSGIALCSALAAYLWMEPDMSHVPSMFLISALIYVLHDVYESSSLDWRKWAVVGLLLGLTVAVRATDVWVIIAALSIGARSCIRSPGMHGKTAACIAACFAFGLLGFAPQLFAWKAALRWLFEPTSKRLQQIQLVLTRYLWTVARL